MKIDAEEATRRAEALPNAVAYRYPQGTAGEAWAGELVLHGSELASLLNAAKAEAYEECALLVRDQAQRQSTLARQFAVIDCESVIRAVAATLKAGQ